MEKISLMNYISNRGKFFYLNVLPSFVIMSLYAYLLFINSLDFFDFLYKGTNIFLLILYIPLLIIPGVAIIYQFFYFVEVIWWKQLRFTRNDYVLFPWDIVYEWTPWDIILWWKAKIVTPPQWVVTLDDNKINVIQTKKWVYEYIKNWRDYTVWDKLEYEIEFHNWYYVYWNKLIK